MNKRYLIYKSINQLPVDFIKSLGTFLIISYEGNRGKPINIISWYSGKRRYTNSYYSLNYTC